MNYHKYSKTTGVGFSYNLFLSATLLRLSLPISIQNEYRLMCRVGVQSELRLYDYMIIRNPSDSLFSRWMLPTHAQRPLWSLGALAHTHLDSRIIPSLLRHVCATEYIGWCAISRVCSPTDFNSPANTCRTDHTLPWKPHVRIIETVE